jgi:Ca-activated chloride channel family protein
MLSRPALRGVLLPVRDPGGRARAAPRGGPPSMGGSERVLGALPATCAPASRWMPGVAACSPRVLIVAALARPLQGREESRVTTEGIDIVLAVDTSSSMLEQGLQRGHTTLDVVKTVVADFVGKRRSDRLGLITFAAWPRTECPLTLDNEGVLARLAQVQCVRRNSEEDGTAIGVALGQAARKLKDSDAKSKVIVLLTDGQNNMLTVDPLEATALCKDLGIKVYTIGAGRQFEQTAAGSARAVGRLPAARGDLRPDRRPLLPRPGHAGAGLDLR